MENRDKNVLLNKPSTEIGGYFELELPDSGDRFPDALKYQSARAAMRAAVQASGFKQVFIPKYICSTIIDSATRAGVKVETYDLDDSLYPAGIPTSLPESSGIIYVNYFGINQTNVKRLLKHFTPSQIIIDSSQALFAPHLGNLATIYSPRKFAGLPDGGLLRFSHPLVINTPDESDVSSLDRTNHLFIRLAYSARSGYVHFDRARQSLADNTPKAMSPLTSRLMRSINWDSIKDVRRRNFSMMEDLLGPYNSNSWSVEGTTPLCYPFTKRGVDLNSTREQLSKMNIFIAKYWPDAAPRISPQSIEHSLMNETLFLPIDQRMDYGQVRFVADMVLQFIR